MNRMIYLGNVAPKMYRPGKLGADPVLTASQKPFETMTTIAVSPDSSLIQAVSEIQTIWGLHSHDTAPSSVGCSEDMMSLALVLCEEFGNVPFTGVVA